MCEMAWTCVRSTYRLSCRSSPSTHNGATPSGSGRQRTKQLRKRRRCKSERPRRWPEPQERAGFCPDPRLPRTTAQRRAVRAGSGPSSCGSVGGARVSVLVVGLSHKSAPVSVLERAAVGGDTLGKLLHDVALLPDIAETFVISTCNRVEVYAEVGRFHGGVAGVCELLSRYSGIPAQELTSCLYVHYEDRAVQHLLAVSSGLESMVVGEDQILGQVRTALKVAGDHGTLGRSLRDLGRLALRTGKRARAETGIDRLGLSLVSVGIELAAPHLSDAPAVGEDQEKLVSNGPGRLSGLHVLVVGAGAMSGLAVATVARAGAARGTVANRTRAKAERLFPGAAAAAAPRGGT